MAKLEIINVADLDPRMRAPCQCCERPLLRKAVWLELDCMTGEYHKPGDVSAERSQGLFLFGVTCARNMLAEAVQ